jgi:flavin reductase (DIM6/NTAB) family NADH-FMN oxidoreductase RutF
MESVLYMKKIENDFLKYADETIKTLNELGLLLVSIDSNGKPNVMTIGWGSIGIIWYKPIFIVLVRQSRYTHKLIEEAGDFTVNVPKRDMKHIIDFCGSVSGKEIDKFKEKNLTPLQSKKVKSPIIAQCPINYECKIVYKTIIDPKIIEKRIISEYYSSGNYHTIFFGEILALHVDENLFK